MFSSSLGLHIFVQFLFLVVAKIGQKNLSTTSTTIECEKTQNGLGMVKQFCLTWDCTIKMKKSELTKRILQKVFNLTTFMKRVVWKLTPV